MITFYGTTCQSRAARCRPRHRHKKFCRRPQHCAESFGIYGDGGNEDTVVTYEFKVSGSLQVKMESAAGSMAGDMDSVPEMPQPEIK